MVHKTIKGTLQNLMGGLTSAMFITMYFYIYWKHSSLKVHFMFFRNLKQQWGEPGVESLK